MKRNLLVLSTSIILSMCSCKTSLFTPESFEGRALHFGNSGGFTGSSTTYTLLENGQVFLEKTSDEQTELKKLKKNTVDQIFSNYDLFDFNSMDCNKAGNITKFLKMADGSGDVKELQWEGFNGGEPDILSSYYANLMHIMKEIQNSDSTLKFD